MSAPCHRIWWVIWSREHYQRILLLQGSKVSLMLPWINWLHWFMTFLANLKCQVKAHFTCKGYKFVAYKWDSHGCKCRCRQR